MSEKCLQHQYAKNSMCYGCGPSNPQGFQIQSYVEEDKIIANWQPESHHQAFPGILNGGVIGTLLDCHCNWAAAWYLMKNQDLNHPPCTVTAEYTIKLLRPTRINEGLSLEATLKEIINNKATISGKLISHGKVCATCVGVFVAVPPGHPAYNRW